MTVAPDDAIVRRRLPVSSAIVAGLVACGAIAVIVVAFLVWASHGFKPLPVSFARGLLSMGVGVAVSTTHLVVGWLLVARAPRNPIGWLLLCGGLTFALVLPIGLLVAEAHQAYRPAPGTTVALAWFQSSFGIPLLGAANLNALLLFPDGRLLSPRWRAIAGIAVLAAVLVGLAAAFDPTGILWYPTLPNPFAAPPELGPLLSGLRFVGVGLALLASALLVASLAFRYRAGGAVVRAQLRWIVYAGAIQVLVFGPFVVARYVVGAPDEVGEVFVALGEAGSAGIPIAAAIAITRYHLFGIDVLISRTVVYLLLMAILGGAFTAVIALSQRLFVASFGTSSDLPLVITVFLVAAAFTPVRRALEGVVDRWTRAGPTPTSASSSPHRTAPAAETGPRPGDLGDGNVARRLADIRRFERRFAAAGPEDAAEMEVAPDRAPGDPAGSAPARRRRIAIDTSGSVACPRYGTVVATTCLGCAWLVSLAVSPPVVTCRGANGQPQRGSLLE